ncbi:MAG: pseudouridine synthase [Lachnospiraceae bacterium]
MRLNKYLSDAGYCSRREADRLIEAGKVFVDAVPAALGAQVEEGQEVRVGKKVISKTDRPVLLALHKPRGIECTSSREVKENIIDFINYPIRIYPVGRLDKDSEGLILMTNQGDLVNKMMRSGNRHEKEYLVTVDKPVTKQFLQKMSGGVYLKELDVKTRACEVEQTGKFSFRIVLTQGLNRQIRRMCQEFHYEVKTLKRIRIMNIQLGDLKKGTYREVAPAEMSQLRELIKNSSNETVRE